MVKTIVKRDGRVIPYTREKITIAIQKAQQSCVQKDGSEGIAGEAEKIALKVEELLNRTGKSEFDIEEVQDAVVETLIHCDNAKTAEAYILYRNERNRARSLKTRLMKSVEEITFADTSDLKRENANIDGNTAMGTMLQYGSTISREFCMDYLLNAKHAEMHRSGDIHIHDLDFYNMGTLTCCQIDLKRLFTGGFSTGHGFIREPQDIMSYAALAAIAIQSNQNDQHGGQSIPAFDYYLADGVKKTFRKVYLENLRKACSVLHLDIPVIDPNTLLLGNSEAILSSFTTDLSGSALQELHDFVYRESVADTDRKTYQAMESLVHNLNTMHSRAGAQVPFSSINFGTDISVEGRLISKNLLLAQEAGLGNGETAIFPILIFKVKEGVNYDPQDPNYDLFKLAMRVSSKRLFPNFSFLDSPFNLKYYRANDPNSEVTYMGCRTRVIADINGNNTVNGRGNLSFTTINLVRLGIKHARDENFIENDVAFFNELDEITDDVIRQLIDRMKVQSAKKVKNFPFLMGQGIWSGSGEMGSEDSLEEVIKTGTLSIGFIGLAECLVALIGSHHGQSEAARTLGLKIIRHLSDRLNQASIEYKLNITLLATPAEGLSGRFTQLDKKIYGEIKGVTDRDYYTNSFHVPVYHPISIYDKIHIEAPYHELTNAGHITYVEVDGDPSENLEAFEMIIRTMKEAGIGYGSINHPLDRDPDCGYNGIIKGNICPQCGRNEDESEFKFERIRRITGYLVGTLDRFNNAKRAEEKQRVKHSTFG